MTSLMKNVLVLLLFLLLMFSGLGCDSRRLNGLVPASGTVRYRGAPVDGALVSFSPAQNGSGIRSASAMADAERGFVLSTLNPNDGAMPGEYNVTIKKMNEDREGAIKHLLPRKYADSKTSALTVRLARAGNREIVFDLDD